MERRIGVRKQHKSSLVHRPRLLSLISSPASVIFLFIAAGILAIPAWHGWQSYNNIKILEEQLKYVVNLEGIYQYRDEALTMSLNMAASTGDKAWVQRYEKLSKRVRPVIEKSWGIPENGAFGADAILTDLACDKLIELENNILNLLKEGNPTYARVLLKNPGYEDQKQTYSQGMKKFLENVNKTLEERWINNGVKCKLRKSR